MKRANLFVFGALSVAFIATSVAAAQVARGTWAISADVEYSDASPVTIKSKRSLEEIENQLRQLGQTPPQRGPIDTRFQYSFTDCIPQDRTVGWIETEQLLRRMNWDCAITGRSDGIDSITVNFVCPNDSAKGALEVRFPTDSSAVGKFYRTDMSGRTPFETATFTAVSTGRTDECAP